MIDLASECSLYILLASCSIVWNSFCRMYLGCRLNNNPFSGIIDLKNANLLNSVTTLSLINNDFIAQIDFTSIFDTLKVQIEVDFHCIATKYIHDHLARISFEIAGK